MLTELDVLNEMLASLGEAPLSDIAEEHPLVPAGRRQIGLSNKKMQAVAWWFNTEIVDLPRDTSGEVYVPADTLSVDPLDPCAHLVQRGRKLYDPFNATYKINKNVRCKLIRLLPFDDLPVPAQQVVSLDAQIAFQKTYDADETKLRALFTEYEQARRTLNADHIRNVDANLLRNPSFVARKMWIRGRVSSPDPFYS